LTQLARQPQKQTEKYLLKNGRQPPKKNERRPQFFQKKIETQKNIMEDTSTNKQKWKMTSKNR
jgi:hypothetical protein